MANKLDQWITDHYISALNQHLQNGDVLKIRKDFNLISSAVTLTCTDEETALKIHNVFWKLNSQLAEVARSLSNKNSEPENGKFYGVTSNSTRVTFEVSGKLDGIIRDMILEFQKHPHPPVPLQKKPSAEIKKTKPLHPQEPAPDQSAKRWGNRFSDTSKVNPWELN
jgi:hypothetical protein